MTDVKVARELVAVARELASLDRTGSLVKKDFVALASLMKSTSVGKNKAFVDGICKWLEGQNPSFDEETFRQAVG
jgi:hypothetical protein